MLIRNVIKRIFYVSGVAGLLLLLYLVQLDREFVKEAALKRLSVDGQSEILVLAGKDCSVSCDKASLYFVESGDEPSLMDTPYIVIHNAKKLEIMRCDERRICIEYEEADILKFSRYVWPKGRDWALSSRLIEVELIKNEY